MPAELRGIHYASTDSTNERIREFARAGEREGLYVSADEQTAGKGRRGRAWESRPGDSVATSLLIKPLLPQNKIPTVTLVAALAAARTIKKLTGTDCLIKWPNDIVINGKKVCGILCETEPSPSGGVYVIVGIGINIHNRSFSGELAQTATSLDLEKPEGVTIHRAEVVRRLWEEFEALYDVFLQTGDLRALRAEYEELLVNRGREVYIEENGHTFCGTAKGVTDDGALLIEADGIIRTVNTGEVSVRGVYGYV